MAVASRTMQRPGGHRIFSGHEDGYQIAPCSLGTCVLLGVRGIAPLASTCPVCGELNRRRIITADDPRPGWLTG